MGKVYSESVARLTTRLAGMPGVGEKTAERLAYHILDMNREDALGLAEAIRDVKDNVKKCSVCCLLSESDPCHVCSDPGRDRAKVCVVEDPRDAAAIEHSGGYDGLYHVLCGRLAPLDDMEPEDLTVPQLLKRVRGGEIREVILATNADMEGDATALFVQESLRDEPVEVTRLARGIPGGSHLHYATAAMLSEALAGRREVKP